MTPHPSRSLIRTIAVLSLSFVATACGGGPEEVGPPEDLSIAGQAGWQVAASKGCMSCHGRDGVGGTGPTWVGLAGSTRTLADGSQVIADREYLVRSLLDPQAQVVNGYNIRMPVADLTEGEIDSILDFIGEIQ